MSTTIVTGARPNLTPTERSVLSYIARFDDHCCLCTKDELASELGRNRKTIDRLVSHLKGEGLIAVTARHCETGGQLPNVYRITELGREFVDVTVAS